MISKPTFEPLFLAIGQHADLKSLEVRPAPTLALRQQRVGEKTRATQPIDQFRRILGGKPKVEIERLPVDTVVADGVATHDEKAQACFSERVRDFEQAAGSAHRSTLQVKPFRRGRIVRLPAQEQLSYRIVENAGGAGVHGSQR